MAGQTWKNVFSAAQSAIFAGG